MKTLSIAMALAFTSGAAQAGSVFEVPINGGIARILLDDNCPGSVCASVSWTEIGRRQDRKEHRKEHYRNESAEPSTRLKRAPAANLTSSAPAPASGSTSGPGGSFGATSAPAPAPIGAGPASGGPNAEPPAMASREPDATVAPPAPASGSTNGPGGSFGATSAPAPAPIGARPAGRGSNAEPPAMASHEPGANIAPPAPVLEPSAVAAFAPPQATVSAFEASEPSPIGEWLVEDGEASIRIEECGSNLCGVVSGAKNWNETDRNNPNPELRNRPIIGMPILLDMKPAKSNRWVGRAYNAKNGQTYTANISLNNSQSLRVEGCVFGGFVCGGQNWTRVN
jgi:uncharacterized protein (DUF2147 family)